MNERTPRIILFAMAGFGLLGGFVLAFLDRPGGGVALISASTLLALVAAVGPQSIRRIRSGRDGIDIQRFASSEEVELSLAVAQQSSRVPQAERASVVEKVKTLPETDCTDASFLVLAFDAYRRTEPNEIIKFAAAGLAAPSSDVRVKATLIALAADAFHQLGDLDKALEEADRSIGIYPEVWLAHNTRSLILGSLGRYDEAFAALDESIRLAPDYAAPQMNRGIFLAELGRHEEALESLDNAIRLDSGFGPIHTQRGNALLNLGRAEEALAAYDRAISLDPMDVHAHNNRGWALAQLDRPEEALAAYGRALQIDSTYVRAYSNRGALLRKLGREVEAQADCARAEELEAEARAQSPSRDR